jgi:hypothetical protein
VFFSILQNKNTRGCFPHEQKRTDVKMGRELPILKWFARLLALACAGFITFMAVAEGFNPAKFTPVELALTVPFAAVWIGFLVGWRWEAAAAILIIGGVTGFYLVHFATTGFERFPRGWVFPALAIPGFLFFIDWLRQRHANARSPAPPD